MQCAKFFVVDKMNEKQTEKEERENETNREIEKERKSKMYRRHKPVV